MAMAILAVASTLGGNATLAVGLACCMLWFFGGRRGRG
jgi:hypothetical protein